MTVEASAGDFRARERRRVLVALTGVQLAFGSWSIVGKVTLQLVTPTDLVFVRLLGGAMLFAALSARAGRPMLPPREKLGETVVLAVAGLLVNQYFFTIGLAHTSAIEASVLGATIPLFAVGYSVLSGRDRASASLWRGLLVALVGTLALSLSRRNSRDAVHFYGNTLILINCVSYAVYLVRAREPMARYGAQTVVAWMFVVAVVLAAPVGVPSLAHHAGAWPVRAWVAIAYVVAVPTAYAYGANAYALQRAPSSLVAAFIYLQPLAATVLALGGGALVARWLEVPTPGEHMTWVRAGAMTCVLVGVWMVARAGGARRGA